jgi:predicted RNA binding protein YcfA (HicA-like mRNA interferase family)
VKLPRDLNGVELARRLSAYGYEVSRTSGDHIRLTSQRNGEHHLTVPKHSVLKPGTLSGILKDVASHLGISQEEELCELLSRGSRTCA